MSIRVDTSSWIPGAIVCGDRGLGVLAEDIPSDGDNGASYLYNDISIPADSGKEICGRVTTWPSAGTLYAYEDGSFEFSDAPDGNYSFQYQLYVDGVASGTGTVSLQVGASTVTISAAAANAVFSGSAGGGAAVSIDAIADNSVFSGGAASIASASALISANTGQAVFSGSAQGRVLFTQEELDYLLAYMQDNLMIPTAADIAAAVVAAMQTSPTPFPSNVTHFNGHATQGSGQPNDPVRPA